MVRLTRQLPDTEVRVESDNNLLTDVETDLPGLGQRVSYFTVTATREAAGDQPSEVISVKLTRSRSEITAANPDLTTMGLIDAVKSIAATCRRMPSWLVPFFRPAGPNSGLLAGVPPLLMFGAAIVGTIGVFSVFDRNGHGKNGPPFTWPTSLVLVIAMAVVLVVLGFFSVSARTVMFTATRDEAPTFWQRHRAEIVINVIIAGVFYLIGLLTAHL